MEFYLKNKALLGAILILALLVGVMIWLSSFEEKGGEDGTIGEFWGSIYGTVYLGPVCPVVMDPPDPSCADKLYETKLVVTTEDQSKVIKEFSSDEEGRFNVEVPPGRYSIRSVVAANVLPYCSLNEVAVVEANSSVEVNVYCDTGIR